MEINDDNYYQVQGWMLNRLEIKGNDLLVFAIIYGFSQDGKGLYSGSLQYLQKFTGSSKNTVLSSLKFLCEKGYIIRDDLVVNDVVFPRYKFNTQFARGVQKLNGGGAEIELGGGAEIAPNNKELYNKVYNKDTTAKKEKIAVAEVPDFVKKEQEEKRKIAEQYTSGKLDEEETKEALYKDEKTRMSFKRVISQNEILSKVVTTDEAFRECFKHLIDEIVHNASLKEEFPRPLVKSREHFSNFSKKLVAEQPERFKKLLIPR